MSVLSIPGNAVDTVEWWGNKTLNRYCCKRPLVFISSNTTEDLKTCSEGH